MRRDGSDRRSVRRWRAATALTHLRPPDVYAGRIASLRRLIDAFGFEIDLYTKMTAAWPAAHPGYTAVQAIDGVGPSSVLTAGRKYTTVQVHTAVGVLRFTSLSSREAAPVHLATYVRGHWSRK